MTSQSPYPARGDEGQPPASEAAPDLQPDGYGVSPDIGLVPAIYVPRSPQQSSAPGLVQRALARAGRLAHGWAARRRQRLWRGEQ